MNKQMLSYLACAEEMTAKLRVGESYDMIRRDLSASEGRMTFFYIDGFVKDTEMQKLMQYFLSLREVGDAGDLLSRLPHVEAERTVLDDRAVTAVLSGQTLMLSSSFGGEGILIDLRTYPSRGVSEPEGDRVMQGARDGFVETLVVNTALLRRRIRDPRLTMRHINLGGISRTDVVLCYLDGVAEEKRVRALERKLSALRPRSLTLGTQSLAESLIRGRWYNPFPKIRTTERPDTAAAQVAEGSILIFCDTSPQVMILPTGLFQYLQQTDDYYFPPLTGSYLRAVRTLILLLSLVITPLWYLALEYRALLPPSLSFLIPAESGALPILLQLYLAEVAIDGLKIASMNTPDMLANSLSVVGALILGDFAVGVGWLSRDVILYMAFVAIASFAQQNRELGYAIKFMRLLLLTLTALFGVFGFFGGLLLVFALAAANRTADGGGWYLYPLLPWDGRALRRLLFRLPKHDFEREEEKKEKKG